MAASDPLCTLLLAGQLDFVLGRIPKSAATSDLTITYLAIEPIALVVRRGHRLAARAEVSPADLLAHDWVMPAEGSPLTDAVRMRLAELNMAPPRQQLATSSFLLTLALIQQSDAIAPLARAVANQFAEGDDAPCRVLNCPLGIEVAPFGLIQRRGFTLTPAAQTLADLVMTQHRRLNL